MIINSSIKQQVEGYSITYKWLSRGSISVHIGGCRFDYISNSYFDVIPFSKRVDLEKQFGSRIFKKVHRRLRYLFYRPLFSVYSNLNHTQRSGQNKYPKLARIK